MVKMSIINVIDCVNHQKIKPDQVFPDPDNALRAN
jgi:hypothetical protein